MAWKLKPNVPSKHNVPEVGTFWMHKSDSSSIYLRIDDAVGSAVLGHSPEISEDKVYSVDCDGFIVHTDISAKDFVNLNPDQIEGLRP